MVYYNLTWNSSARSELFQSSIKWLVLIKCFPSDVHLFKDFFLVFLQSDLHYTIHNMWYWDHCDSSPICTDTTHQNPVYYGTSLSTVPLYNNYIYRVISEKTTHHHGAASSCHYTTGPLIKHIPSSCISLLCSVYPVLY